LASLFRFPKRAYNTRDAFSIYRCDIMNRLVVMPPLRAQLDDLAGPVEIVDETGRRLGHFVPVAAATVTDACPYSASELERMRSEEGGRSLPEIWRSLGAK
jgi:hypothetical protein